ncbi:MAG: DUF2867 domain-containing protein [Tannerellaceae bacterium]|jgi:hypothetical protein|nr:DUF2867 domain-containing protein [Tannerellaceae bacterium]
MKITRSPLPRNSLAGDFLPSDYVETYCVIVQEHSRLTPDNILIGFWTDFPGWVRALFRLRDCLAGPFGLKAAGSAESSVQKFGEVIRSGGRMYFMSVPAKTADETVLQLTDKHLTAELSVRNEKSDDGRLKISITTLVHYHNAFGRIYFFFVRPFHKIIVKALIRRSIRRLMNQPEGGAVFPPA